MLWATATATKRLWKPRNEKACLTCVLLAGVDIKMFYGGPKEAVMSTRIYRQNMGITNIVIGRKHADAPYAVGTAIWGDFDAQEIFSKLKGDPLQNQADQGRLCRLLRPSAAST